MNNFEKALPSYDLQALPTARNDQNILLGGSVAEQPQDEAIYSELEKLGTEEKIRTPHPRWLIVLNLQKTVGWLRYPHHRQAQSQKER